MGRYDVPLKYRTVIKALKKLGFEIDNASNHQTATHEQSGRKTTIPRHTELNKFTVGSIIEFVIDCGLDKDQVENVFGIKK